MENKKKKGKSPIISEWIECQSKRRPGNKYLFNCVTGESKWINSKEAATPPIKSNRVSSTPANDRLKRLQKELRKEKPLIKPNEDKTIENKLNNQKTVLKHKEDRKAVAPPKSKIKGSVTTSLPPKERLEKCKPTVTGEKVIEVPINIPKKPNEKISNKDSDRSDDKRKQATRKRTASKVQQAPVEKDFITNVQTIRSKNLERPSNGEVYKEEPIKKRILEKSTEISESFKTGKPSLEENVESIFKNRSSISEPLLAKKSDGNYSLNHVENPASNKYERGLVDKNYQITNRTSQKTTEIQENQDASKIEFTFGRPVAAFRANEASLEENDESTFENREVPELKMLTKMSNNSNTPKLELKRSANKRLEDLREKLKNENIQMSLFGCNDNTIRTTKSEPECEAMDWESTDEIFHSWSDSFLSLNNSTILDEPTEMEVDENLMLAAAVNKHDMKKNWQKHYIYIVLDTNVLIHHLSFIEELAKKHNTNEFGLILYIPYIVLNELDRLKSRDNTGFRARQAIKYLNKMENDEHFQTQNAVEDSRNIIDVRSADDSILNCCLQVKEHIEKVVLLTEDVNLRNKAKANDIHSASTTNLIEKHLSPTAKESLGVVQAKS